MPTFPIYLYKAPESHVAVLSFSGLPANECRVEISEDSVLFSRRADGVNSSFPMSHQEAEAFVAAWLVFSRRSEMIETQNMKAVTINQ